MAMANDAVVTTTALISHAMLRAGGYSGAVAGDVELPDCIEGRDGQLRLDPVDDLDAAHTAARSVEGARKGRLDSST